MPLKRPLVAAILCLCSVRAYPHVAERVESDASSTRALLPNAADALVTNDAERRITEFRCEKRRLNQVGGFHTRLGRIYKLRHGVGGYIQLRRTLKRPGQTRKVTLSSRRAWVGTKMTKLGSVD